MVSITSLLVLCSCFAVVTAESVTPIWLSPLTPTPTSTEFPSPRGQWTNITTGVGSRGDHVMEVDSNGTIWIYGGFGNYLNAVWNYDPKTDLYRWVAGSLDHPDSNYIMISEYGVPNAAAFPGFLAFSASAIDHDNNIWNYGSLSYGIQNMFWRFNTTTYEFTNFVAVDTAYPVYDEVGVPSADNSPGNMISGRLLVDSQNNLWLIGGLRGQIILNSVWHFNTTSLMWTFMWGQANADVQIDFENKIWNGRWAASATIDEEDRIWVFGGFGYDPHGMHKNDWGDLWSFDTKTLEWRVEWGDNSSFATNSSLAVPGEYDINNYPRSRSTHGMVDRLDGTLLIGGGIGHSAGVALNDYWLFNKTSKLWKHVYGNVSVVSEHSTEFTHYRTIGSELGSRYEFGFASGVHNRGNLFICGGHDVTEGLYVFSDIWIFPQCFGCDINADCTLSANDSSNTCTCKEGYTGDGKTCTLIPMSSPLNSPPNNPSNVPNSCSTPLNVPNNGNPSKSPSKSPVKLSEATVKVTASILICLTMVIMA